ncbi:MAG: hypothetical protein ACI4VQ_07335 [Clostridia bacterium]
MKAIMEEIQEEQIENNIMQIYKNLYPQENNVLDITYFPNIKFNPDGILMECEEQSVYIVKNQEPILDSNNKKTEISFDLYIKDGNVKMATIRDGKIYFTPEYMEYIKQLSSSIYKVIEKQNESEFEIDNQREENLEGQPRLTTLSKEELEQKAQQSENDNSRQQTPAQAIDEREESQMDAIARKSGLTLGEIKACSSLNPAEKITDEKSFEDITKTRGRYTKVFMVASNSQTRGNSRFAFWGVTPEGEVEQVQGLEERNGTNTGKEIYAINADGSCVREKQTTALFTLEGMEEGFSITIGQYGILEAEYLRKSSTENKYIGSSINTTHQRPTRRQVQEFMNDKRTNQQELNESIEKTEEQLDEVATTKLQNIDDNPNNDKAIDSEQEIKMHNGEITTLEKEAWKYDMSIQEYIKLYEQIEGDCLSEKVENIRNKKAIEREPQRPEEIEILTPEEQALKNGGLL